jgi:hypothetical protein
MKGRAHRLLADFKASLSGTAASFMMARLILRAKIIPAKISEETDDPSVEARIEAAITALRE